MVRSSLRAALPRPKRVEESFIEALWERGITPYPRPSTVLGHTVPEILISGDHARSRWRLARSRGGPVDFATSRHRDSHQGVAPLMSAFIESLERAQVATVPSSRRRPRTRALSGVWHARVPRSSRRRDQATGQRRTRACTVRTVGRVGVDDFPCIREDGGRVAPAATCVARSLRPAGRVGRARECAKPDPGPIRTAVTSSRHERTRARPGEGGVAETVAAEEAEPRPRKSAARPRRSPRGGDQAPPSRAQFASPRRGRRALTPSRRGAVRSLLN